MLDNVLYLLRETVLSGYLALLAAQILLLIIAIRKNESVWWIIAYVLDGISILTALTGAIHFFGIDGIGHLADSVFSTGALWVFILMLSITLSIKLNSKRDG